MKTSERLKNNALLIDGRFGELVPDSTAAYAQVIEAMRYSFLSGGKRIRGSLTLEFCRALDDSALDSALTAAAAVEMVHCYSLVHDDLPAMDNDDLRRGKPTCHCVYGDAIAILAGDAMLTQAFFALSASKLPAELRVDVIRRLAVAAGMDGMIGGQVIDIISEGQAISPVLLHQLDLLKTGKLLSVSCAIGAVVGGADHAMARLASEYGRAVGQAFQIVDDILDVESTTEQLGKAVLSDERNAKTTYYTLLGRDGAMERARELTTQAQDTLRRMNIKSEFLHALPGDLLHRTY